jgi:DNA-binding transcriptional LysR family regulator
MARGWIAGLISVALAAVTAPAALADPSDFQYVRTESGAVRCVISADHAACERGGVEGFPDAPPGQVVGHQNIAGLDADGTFRWTEGNIGGGSENQDVVLTYGNTYRFKGWTILPSFDGTRLTNDGSGHGMFVSIDGVSTH